MLIKLKRWLCEKGFHPYTEWISVPTPFIGQEALYRECQVCKDMAYQLKFREKVS